MLSLPQRLSTLLLTTLFALCAAAQQFAVSGRLCERGDTLTPLPLCSVELLRATDSLRIAYVTTGNDGRFTLAPTAEGNYLVRASFIGYDTAVQAVSVTQQRPSVQLADIIMEDKSHRLGEAQVTTLSRQLTIKADTFIYHAAAFQVPAGATLSVLLKQLPGLEMQSDGTLKFQGKTVSSILVGGKEFFGSNETALANLPAEAVSEVKAYEKTDELKAFTGTVDTDKATVLDLKIKREWLGVWSGNFDVAGGTDERYALRAFASTFTDHRRLALYGAVNDISERQAVDENGEWSNRSNTNGLLNYREAGVIYSWDNGRKEGSPGAFDIHLNASATHNDYTYDRRANSVTLLADRSAQYAYAHSYSRDHQVSGEANVTLKWVTDSLNYLRFYGEFSKNKSRTPYQQLASTYSAEQLRDDAYATLMTTSDTTAAVYGASDGNLTANKFIEYTTKFDWVHRFIKAGRSLNFGLNFYGNSNDKATDYLTLYRHYNSSALRTVNRQYNDADTDSQGFTFSAIYEDALSKALRLHVDYNYAYSREADGRTLWQLDRDLAYASDALPLGTRPLLVDSLMNVDNTYHGTLYDNTHALSAGIKGQWEHFEMSFTASGQLTRKSLHYARGRNYYSPSQTERDVRPTFICSGCPRAPRASASTIRAGATSSRSTTYCPLWTTPTS